MRLLIIKTSALGDIVHALPVLTALRRALPGATIGWVVEDVFAPLLEAHPDLDEVVPVRTRLWRRMSPLRSLRQIGSFLRALQGFAPDVALDLMGNHKSGMIAALSLADRRVGLHPSRRREAMSGLWINEFVTPDPSQHAVDDNLALLQALAIEPRRADFGADKLTTENGAAPSLPPEFILIHPGAGWGNKRYPAAGWGRVAAIVGSHLDRPVLVASGPGEQELANQVVDHSFGAAQAMHLPSLSQLLAALRRARLVLAGDTGPMHLAHALGTATLAVMGPTDPRHHGPYGAPERTIVHRLPCSFCHRRFEEAKACLLEIRPEAIAERALQLLA